MSCRRKWLKLTFNSDWHVGSGAGIPGSVDRLVLRDENGFPYVPGKTLTGMLRDAAEWIADTRGGQWPEVLINLFGNQPETHGGIENTEATAAKIGVGSAELDKDIREYIIKFSKKDTDIDMIAALFSVHPGVKIDMETGRSLDDHLFSTEKSRHDCVLYAPVIFMNKLDVNEEKLLNDAVKAVRRIGGKRRRGAGECSLVLYDECDYQKSHETMPQLNFNFKRNSDGSVTLDIRLKTLQPLVITRTTLGNEVRSDTEIHGSMLLSYYINNVLSPLGKDRVMSAVMNGEITVSGFLPEFGGKASMPVPLCLGELKEEKIPLNRLVTLPQDSKKQIKDIRTGYVTVSGESMIYHSGASQRVIRTHNTVNDAFQRPNEDVGGLFTYEAVRAGENFRGTLHIKSTLWNEIENSPESKEIFSRLSHDYPSFGRSRKDEYGDAELTCISTGTDGNLGSTELIDGRNIKAKGKYCVVYLLSDLLLRNKYQGYTVRLDDVRNALSEKLGVKLDDIPDDEWDEKEDYSVSPLGGTRGHCVRAVRRESWQRSWTLPRPSLVFLKAGSVFMFKVSDPENWNENKALTLMLEGLGERTTEGYGRILINPPFLCGKNTDVIKSSEENNNLTSDDELKLPENKEDRNFIFKLAADAIKKKFRQTARREAYNIVNGNDNTPFAAYPNVHWDDRPSASQFGALREAAATLDGNLDTKNKTEIFTKWAQAVSREDRVNNPWKEHWRKMLVDMANRPEIIWELRPEAFEKLKENFNLFKLFNKSNELEIEFIRSSDMLGVFLELLCEAVFDDEKRKEQDKLQPSNGL